MNKDRRDRISEAKDLIEEAKTVIEEVSAEEQDSFDTLPESLQYGGTGTKMIAAIDLLDNSISSLDKAVEHLTKAAS